MQGTNALLIIVIGLLVLYLAVTGRYKCLTNLIACIGGSTCSCSDGATDTQTVLQAIKPLTPLRPLQ